MFAEPTPGGATMAAGAVYTLPAQRSVAVPPAGQRPIPMATWGGKLRSFTLPRESSLHALLVVSPPTKDEDQHNQTHNGESGEHRCMLGEKERSQVFVCVSGWANSR